jgi:hypothetical protein
VANALNRSDVTAHLLLPRRYSAFRATALAGAAGSSADSGASGVMGFSGVKDGRPSVFIAYASASAGFCGHFKRKSTKGKLNDTT